jgi:hypothetical protein
VTRTHAPPQSVNIKLPKNAKFGEYVNSQPSDYNFRCVPGLAVYGRVVMATLRCRAAVLSRVLGRSPPGALVAMADG